MMNYWDSSALVTLFIEQNSSAKYRSIYLSEGKVITAWHAVAECASAFCRIKREGLIEEQALSSTIRQLQAQAKSWYIVTPGNRLEQWTLRVLRLHPLRAMDSIHLAAAILARGEDVAAMRFLSEDIRLLEAAAKEGFSVD
ncbi:MAG: type II toxin-antitoxin system VapC family toxin [Verrucomicrobia bacterium]|nr:type II toxin-antitoxin system VapC family toxin [Verrucomicrobiota bacterium]